MYIYKNGRVGVRLGEVGITIIVSPQSPEPIYRQIEEQVKAAFYSGELSPGDELPSIRRLALELRVSVITTKRAYEELERGGWITTIPARGSFVADPDRGELRARREEAIRTGLAPFVGEARALGLSLDELRAIVDSLYKEKEDA